MNADTVLGQLNLHFGMEFFSDYIAEHYGGEGAEKTCIIAGNLLC